MLSSDYQHEDATLSRHTRMRLAIMCILCALSLACVGEPVASPGPHGVAPTLEPGQMRHPGDLAVSIMARMDDLSLASWECYFPIKIRGLVPRVLYIINVEVGCLGGAQGAAEGGGSNNDCGNVYFVEQREFSVSADRDEGGGVVQTVLIKIPHPTRADVHRVQVRLVDAFPGLKPDDGFLAHMRREWKLAEPPHNVEKSSICPSAPDAVHLQSLQGRHPIIMEWTTLRSDNRGARSLVMPIYFRDPGSAEKKRVVIVSLVMLRLADGARTGCAKTNETFADPACSREVLYTTSSDYKVCSTNIATRYS
jgi:hypothetical protein